MKIKGSLLKSLLLLITAGIAYWVLYSQLLIMPVQGRIVLDALPIVLGSIAFFGLKEGTKIVFFAGVLALPIHFITSLFNPDSLGYGIVWGGVTAGSLLIATIILVAAQRLFFRTGTNSQFRSKSIFGISSETGTSILVSALLLAIQICTYFFVLQGSLGQ